MSETKKQRVNIDDFDIKDLIGKGFFGEVHLAIEKVTRDVFAIKKIPKTSIAQSKEERNIMATSRSDWIPLLFFAFQVSITIIRNPNLFCKFLEIIYFEHLDRIKHICIW